MPSLEPDPAILERKVRDHLRGILYHNLAKVDVLYNIALGIRILNLAPDKVGLFNAVKLRHDCVHRNGLDKDGKELVAFTKSFLSETADLIRDFVESIEKAVRARSAGQIAEARSTQVISLTEIPRFDLIASRWRSKIQMSRVPNPFGGNAS